MYWSWILGAAAVAVFWIIGSGHLRLGWALAFAQEILWGIYALVTHQLGFLVMAAVFLAVYARNWAVAPPAAPSGGKGPGGSVKPRGPGGWRR